tara:strand:- start:1637 stop:2014 length:378 start_codon:yes stop_codon:yes gene_type:complete
MQNENEKPLLSSGGEIYNPKGLYSPPSRECEKSQSRRLAAERVLDALKAKPQITPERETKADELRRCADGNIRGTLNGIETEVFQSESTRPGAIPGIKYDFVRFKNHPSFDEYGNYIGKNKIIGE